MSTSKNRLDKLKTFFDIQNRSEIVLSRIRLQAHGRAVKFWAKFGSRTSSLRFSANLEDSPIEECWSRRVLLESTKKKSNIVLEWGVPLLPEFTGYAGRFTGLADVRRFLSYFCRILNISRTLISPLFSLIFHLNPQLQRSSLKFSRSFRLLKFKLSLNVTQASLRPTKCEKSIL